MYHIILIKIFGIVFIYVQATILNTVGVLYSNIFLCGMLAIGTIMTSKLYTDL